MNDISLSYLVRLALRRLWILVIAAVVFGASTFAYLSIAITPRYKASGSILVTNGALISQSTANNNKNKDSTVNGSDISASLDLSNTIVELLKTRDIYKQLQEKLESKDLKYSYSTLQGMASIARRDEETLFIDISFTGTDADDLVTITNEFLELTPDYIADAIDGAKGKVTSSAENASKTYPRTFFSTMLMAGLGFAIAFVIVLIVDMLDHAIKSEDDFRARFNLPILGTIPDFDIAGTSQKAKELYEYGNKK